MSLLDWIRYWEGASNLLELLFNSDNNNPDPEETIEFTSIIRKCFDE